MKVIVWMSVLMAVCLAVFPAVVLHREAVAASVLSEELPKPLKLSEQAKEKFSLPEEILEPPISKEKDNQTWPPFRILDRSTGEIREVAVKDYVQGAVCSEMPATFHLEALKSQAVSAHTWALYCQKQAQEKGSDYDFSADPSHWQGYVTKEQAQKRFGDSFEEYWAKITEATEAVWKEILLDPNGTPVVAAYHAISSGKTESAENVWGNALPCLTAVESKDDICAPGYEKAVSFSQAELQKILTAKFPQIVLPEDPLQWVNVTERSASGYVLSAQVGNQQMSGIELRELLGLRSSHFDIEVKDGNFIFTAHGYGHGVGLSQYGADFMARQGKNYRDILMHYYQGADLVERE